ncbi:MAG: DUF3226 domain-containing protein [Pseudomonadota bacterium]
MEYGYLVVEGTHDLEFVGKILKHAGLKLIRKHEELDAFWKNSKLIPTVFPFDGDLLKRAPVPQFYQNNNIAIAIHCANSITNLTKVYKYTFDNDNRMPGMLKSAGAVCDADNNNDNAVESTFNGIRGALPENYFHATQPGVVTINGFRNGAFIMPDNVNNGTFEDLLIECGKKVYRNLFDGASVFINGIDLTKLNTGEKKELNKFAGKKKAIIGCMGNVLRPSKSIAVTISDNRWVSADSLKLPNVKRLVAFISQLFDL